MSDEKKIIEGPLAYDNWRHALAGEPVLVTFEVPLFSDSHFTGQVTEGLGPYRFINLVPFRPQRSKGFVKAAVILQFDLHADFDIPDMRKTDHSRYHGGGLTDEIAALASLMVGARFRAGEVTRRFDPGGDPRGWPQSRDLLPEPELRVGVRGFVSPTTAAEHSLTVLRNLGSLARLELPEVIAAMKAARMYQDSLWLAESEPSLAWLMMVSAVEIAASRWRSQLGNFDILQVVKPDLVPYLEELGIDGLSERIAQEFAPLMRSTRKFIDFLMAHLPEPPAERPHVSAQLEWSEKNLKRAFSQVYNFRSKALHDGTPFPAPMCEPPSRHQEWTAYAERPNFLAASSHGAKWLAKDIPMHFHMFEYIARRALTSWWKNLCP